MSVKINEKQRLFVFINLMITGIATSMLATAMTTALPPVVEYFGISMTTGQWMTSGYSLAMGIVIIDGIFNQENTYKKIVHIQYCMFYHW